MNNQPSPVPVPQVKRWLITLTVMLPTVIEILDMSVANVALGHIQGSLSAGLDEVTWVLTSYLVSNAIIIPITGWLAGTFGRKNYLIFSLGLFTLSSLACGAAPSLETLIFFRILQGLGGGALQPLALSILLETYPPKEHGMAMAIYGIGVVFGPILGPLLGGYLTDNLSWRWIFYINLPLGGLAILMAFFFIFDPTYIRQARTQIDYWGLGLLSVGLGCLQIVLDRGERDDWFDSSFILWLSVMAVICLILFVWVELRVKAPVVRLQVFKNRSFSAGNLIIFLGFFSFFGSIVLLPIYLQNLMGYTAFLAGLVLGPGGLSTLFMMPIVGRLVGVIDARYALEFRHGGQCLCPLSHVRLYPGDGFLEYHLAQDYPGRGDQLFFCSPVHPDPVQPLQTGNGERERHLQPAAEPGGQLRGSLYHHHPFPSGPVPPAPFG